MTRGLRARISSFFSANGPVQQIPEHLVPASPVLLQPEDSEEQEIASEEGTAPRTGDMRTFYLSHGSPMLPIQFDEPARQFMVDLSKKFKRPKAIVMISAHWDTTEPTVNAMQTNDTIHDFYGFPKELYKLQYNAPGNPQLAQRVVDLLKKGGFSKARLEERRGLDHGAWVPLLMMYPEKDIPVVQLSIQCRRDGAHHYKLGQALAPLKKEGVLIIGSGSATHNLRALNFGTEEVEPWALAFDNWLTDAVVKKRHDDVINFMEKAPYARKAHPTPDHFLPAIVALGAAGEDAIGERIHNSWVLGTLSMSSFEFKPVNA